MFGMDELTYALLRRALGLRSDAASATGSVHAKLAEQLARIGSPNPGSAGTDTLFRYFRRMDEKYYTASTARYSGTTSGERTIHSITGQGYVSCAMVVGSDTINDRVELVVDGTLRMRVRGYSGNSYGGLISADLLQFDSSELVVPGLRSDYTWEKGLLSYNKILPWPYTELEDGSTATGFILVSYPIFFKSSCVFKFYSSSNRTIRALFLGGVAQ